MTLKMKNISAPCGIKSALLALVAIGSALNLTAQTAVVPPATNTAPWESTAAAGLTLTRGNSKTLLATIDIGTQRKSKVDEILLGADATYGEDNDVKNAETLHGFGQYNRFITERFYYGLRLDGMHDAIADVNYRFTVSPLLGYYLIKQTNTTLSVEAGPGYVYQRQGGVSKGYATLRLGERFEHKFSAAAKMWQSFEILPELDKFNNYNINAEIGAEAALTKHASLRSYIQDTYYNIPAAGREKNDVKLVGALAYKF